MPSKKRVLVTAPPILPSIDNYRAFFEENNIEIVKPDFEFKESLSEKDLLGLLVDVDGILCGDDQLTARVLEKANKLKVISKWGTGIDSIDIEAAKRFNIKVSRVEGAFVDPVADTVLAYMLFFARRIIEKDRLVRNGGWHKVKSYSLKERSLGVIGVGHIGSGVVRRASAFGMTIYCCDIKPISAKLLEDTNAQSGPLEMLLSHSDFVSLNCDLNKSSRHIINKHTLDIIKLGAVLINTARGALIDELALIDCLSSGKLGGVALDVFESEPLSLESPLRKFPNVLLSPHNSNASPKTFKTVDLASIRNVLVGLAENVKLPG